MLRSTRFSIFALSIMLASLLIWQWQVTPVLAYPAPGNDPTGNPPNTEPLPQNIFAQSVANAQTAANSRTTTDSQFAPPQTGLPLPPALTEFASTVENGQAGVVRGVFVDGLLALPVLQQPPGDPAYVPPEEGLSAQFQTAIQNNVTGIIAHNYLSGELFFDLTPGQLAFTVYGDGRVQAFQVQEIQQFQKLTPNNLLSDYIDLQTGEELSSTDVFNRVYSEPGTLVFQTCIEKDGEWSWGLFFVLATPAG